MRTGALASILSCILIVMGSSPTLAEISCGYQTTYHAYQQSVNGFYGVLGNITDPRGSFLQGSNDQYQSHLTVYLNMINELPTGPCGAGSTKCWVQIGMAMGEFPEDSDCHVPPPPPLSQRSNFSNNWAIFFEDIGAGGIDNCYDVYYRGEQWAISQDTSVEFHVKYDGRTGYTNQPQFQAFAKGMYVNEGELYSTIDHAKASSEAYTGYTTLCPYLTYGQPYLHFGTDNYGNFTGGAYELELQPQPQGAFVGWGGNPNTGENVTPGGPIRYWYRQLSNFPRDFQTNGPSTSAQPPYP